MSFPWKGDTKARRARLRRLPKLLLHLHFYSSPPLLLHSFPGISKAQASSSSLSRASLGLPHLDIVRHTEPPETKVELLHLGFCHFCIPLSQSPVGSEFRVPQQHGLFFTVHPRAKIPKFFSLLPVFPSSLLGSSAFPAPFSTALQPNLWPAPPLPVSACAERRAKRRFGPNASP